MAKPLTKAQRNMLLDLGGHTVDHDYHNPTKTYRVLIQRGLANPRGGDGWTLTDAGRALAAELAKSAADSKSTFSIDGSKTPA